MNILVTGSKGFVGKNLIATLENIRDGKDRTHQINGCMNPGELNIYQYDIDSNEQELEEYCRKANFVINLAGVNRPENVMEYMTGNLGFSNQLLKILERNKNTCPVILSSSIQASLQGRYSGSEYGKSKRAGEELFQEYSSKTGVKVLIYRFSNIFGKWCRPNYNSAVATFCFNIAHNLPIQLNDRKTEMELIYIDDLIEELLGALNEKEHYNAEGYCYVPVSFHKTLGEIADLIESFKASRQNKVIPNLIDAFTNRLYSTYISYLPEDDFVYSLKMNMDNRGSFTEILKSDFSGQFSVNISKPGIAKGNHWHHSKLEKFVVVSGKALIQLRKIGIQSDGQLYPIIEYHVNSEELTVIDIPPGYTHTIVNEGEIDLITFMWSNESFNPERPDTYNLTIS